MRKTIYQGKYITMSTETIANHIYERVTLRPGIKIIPIKNNKILFIKEYRQHEKSSRLKLVSGWVDKKNKSVLKIAKDELREEASYQAKKWSLFHTRQTPNQTIESHTDYFLAKGLTKLPQQKNPDNDIVEEVIFLTKNAIIKKLRQKKITWDDDIAVVLMYFESLSL